MTAINQKDLNAQKDPELDEEGTIELPFHGVIYVRRDLLISMLTEALARTSQSTFTDMNTQPPGNSRPVASAMGWPADAAAFGSLLREHRTDAGLTRAQLALQSGVAASTIRNIESKRHKPTELTRKLLMKAFALLHKTLDS